MTLVVETFQELFAQCERARHGGERVGFVPTMGALHEGHISLVEAARRHGATFTVVSIFVNPLQFGPSEDYTRYPRTFEADVARCREAEVDLVYAPAAQAMYPEGFQTKVELSQLTTGFEGSFRPGHFAGVCTVVLKLWNAVGSCVSLFGRKDYQQWRVLSQLALDLDLPIEVVGANIVRESDGLAMSSRNRYLDASARERALAIAQGLRAAFDAHRAGERSPARLTELVRAPIEAAFDRIDYVACVDPKTLTPLTAPSERSLLLVAAHLGSTRLIDNLELGRDPRP
ncbi:MAG TPA: pantoate--beta-alanine ligase [Polyangiales bacterium]